MSRIELEIAIEVLIKHTRQQNKTKLIHLNAAVNHHISQDIYASTNVPNFNRAAMDGYAVKALSTKCASKNKPIKLKVGGTLFAGDYLSDTDAQAFRIMAGAAIPNGYDAVIKQEDTDLGESEVLIYDEVKPYTNYAKIGEDIKKDELIIKQYTRLTPYHIGILASLGMNEIEVLQPLKVGLISSGSELITPDEELPDGHIYDSNRYVLASRLQEMNVEVILNRHINDKISDMVDLISTQISQVDMIITTGGVSVGEKDIMPEAMEKLSAKRLFWGIKIRPGTPALANIYQDKLVLSLSGNPFAALTTFELLFRPALAKIMQNNYYLPRRKKATLMNDFDKSSTQRRFVRAYCEDGQVYLPTNEHASSVLSSMIDCNCFIDIKTDSKPMNAGSIVEIVVI